MSVKASPAMIRTAKSRGILDAVEGKPCEPGAVTTEELHAYCKAYTDYFGADNKRAYQLLDIMATSPVFKGESFRTAVAAHGYEQLPLFGGGGDEVRE